MTPGNNDCLGDIDEWQLTEHNQDPKNTGECDNTENETDPLSNCDPLPKHLQEVNQIWWYKWIQRQSYKQ